MAKERLYLFDTTLRDGAQTNGVDFTLADKLAIAAMLDDLGVDYIEGGYPGANPTDTQLFAEDRKLAATFTAFSSSASSLRSVRVASALARLTMSMIRASWRETRCMNSVRSSRSAKPSDSSTTVTKSGLSAL